MTIESRSSSRVLAYLQLMRLPNVFTAMADVAMGFLFTHSKLSPFGVFALLLIASSALYTFGMVLNDVFDVEADRRQRPQRPLPSGRVPLRNAKRLAWSLLLFGLAAGWCGAWIAGNSRCGIVAVALATLIILYDDILKGTRAAPWAMGGCRMLNVLLGMSVLAEPWSAAHWLVASGVGVYVAGVTLFAAHEAAVSRRANLIAGFFVMLVGIAIMFSWNRRALEESAIDYVHVPFWVLLAAIIAVSLGWRFALAIVRPEPENVQAAVKHGILSIVVLDAAVVFAARGPVMSIMVLLLLVPAIVLGRWVYST